MEDVAFTSALLEDDSKSSYPNSTLRNETTLFNSSYSKNNNYNYNRGSNKNSVSYYSTKPNQRFIELIETDTSPVNNYPPGTKASGTQTTPQNSFNPTYKPNNLAQSKAYSSNNSLNQGNAGTKPLLNASNNPHPVVKGGIIRKSESFNTPNSTSGIGGAGGNFTRMSQKINQFSNSTRVKKSDDNRMPNNMPPVSEGGPMGIGSTRKSMVSPTGNPTHVNSPFGPQTPSNPSNNPANNYSSLTNSNNNVTNMNNSNSQVNSNLMNSNNNNNQKTGAYPILQPYQQQQQQQPIQSQMNPQFHQQQQQQQQHHAQAPNSQSQRDDQLANEHVKEKKVTHPVEVTSRIVFLKVGQIDTRNERYDAEAYIECSWEDDAIFKVLADPNLSKNVHNPTAIETILKQTANTPISTNNLLNLKNIINNINSLEYDPNIFWSPQLYIENAIGDLKEEIRYKLEIVEKANEPRNSGKNLASSSLTVRVCEMRKLRGVFYERLELYDFPMDIQELSITLTSKRSANDVHIIENKKDLCSINTEDFLDQQEWDLFGHVKTSQKEIYDPWRKYDRSGFSVTCFIARKPGYYLYNAYMLIFLITILGFVPFAFDPAGPQFRCQVTGLLLLTSVNFRWIVTQRLPSVPYLTSLDKYAIGSLLFLVLFCVWHSMIGSSVITADTTNRKTIDSYVLYGSAGFYLLYNLFYILWFVKMFGSIKKFETESRKEKQKADMIQANNLKEKNASSNSTKSRNQVAEGGQQILSPSQMQTMQISNETNHGLQRNDTMRINQNRNPNYQNQYNSQQQGNKQNGTPTNQHTNSLLMNTA